MRGRGDTEIHKFAEHAGTHFDAVSLIQLHAPSTILFRSYNFAGASVKLWLSFQPPDDDPGAHLEAACSCSSCSCIMRCSGGVVVCSGRVQRTASGGSDSVQAVGDKT